MNILFKIVLISFVIIPHNFSNTNQNHGDINLVDREDDIKVKINLYKNQKLKEDLGFKVFVEGWKPLSIIDIYALGPQKEVVELIKENVTITTGKSGKIVFNVPYSHESLYPGKWMLIVEGKSGKHGHHFQVPKKENQQDVILKVDNNVERNNGDLGFRIKIDNWGNETRLEIHLIDRNGKKASLTSEQLQSDKEGYFSGYIPYSYGDLASGNNILLVAGKIGAHKIMVSYPEVRSKMSDKEIRQKAYCKILTDGSRTSSPYFHKSHFTYDKMNTLIQVMYASEMAADKGMNLNAFRNDAKDPEFINVLSKYTLKGYRNINVNFIDQMENNKFSYFQFVLIFDDNTKYYSKRTPIN
jgi:hypothetical protein